MINEDFVDWCLERKISLSLDGQNLKINAEPGALTPDVVARLKADKSDIIEWLKSRQSVRIQAHSDPQAPVPLSYAQKRLWVIDQMQSDTSNYNMLGGFRIEGRCHFDRVERVFQSIVDRHQILRTRFESRDEVLQQIVQTDKEFTLIRHDFSENTCVAQASRSQDILKKEAGYQFDLSGELLIRAHLIKLSEDSWQLIVNMHHIASDGWSLGVICDEFVQLYAAFSQGESNPLPPLEIQYADFAHWQQQSLSGPKREEQLNFWQNQLSGLPELHNLPLDRPRTKRQDYRAQSVAIQVDPQRHQQLKHLASQQNVTLFMLLQTLFAVQIGRISGEEDIVMGIPSAGRSRTELAPLIGFFINTLVFRTQWTGNPSFEAVLQQNKQSTLDTFSHQDMPFDLLVDELKVSRDLAYNPLCQIKFMLRSESSEALTVPGLTIHPMPNQDPSVRFDLDLSITESDQGLHCFWCFKSALFDQTRIEQMAEQFDTMLSAILRDVTIPLADFPLMSNLQKQSVLGFGRGKNESYADLPSPIAAFENQAELTPQALAAKDGTHALTYAELNAKTNRLADYLIEAGIEPGERIAVYLDGNVSMLLALLASLKVQATYIPIDPQNSVKRVSAILDDADIEMIITDSDLLAQLPIKGANVLTLDDWSTQTWLSAYSDRNPKDQLCASDSAYVIYTSGSTGRPKGVEISYQSMSDYCHSAINGYYANNLTGSLVVTSHAFDITVPGLYLPLMRGGCVHLLTGLNKLEVLFNQLKNQQHQLVRMTPMHVKGVLAQLGESIINAPHTFVIGGETFDLEVARALQTHFPNSQIYNHYGPTEATVGCCMFDVTHHLDTLIDAVPLGSPFANHQLVVLDDLRQLVAPGQPGQLYVAGAGLAKGYLEQQALTEQKFFELQPFNKRFYATGDRVRWNKSGQLEFLERIDNQLKLKGYRIEASEVEQAILAVPGTEEAKVLIKHQNSHPVLCAFVRSSASEDQLISGLKNQLPDYMVPAAWKFIERMPLNEVGKIDRQALLAMDVAPRVSQSVTAPRNAIESKLLAIWQDILGLVDIGINDNFFSLGGDSIQSIQTVARAAKQGLYITTQQMFEFQTIAELARQASTDKPLDIDQTPLDGEFIPFPVQMGFLAGHPHRHHYHQSVMLTLPSALLLSQLKQIVTALMTRHDGLRLRFTADNTAHFLPLPEHDLDACVTVQELASFEEALLVPLVEQVEAELNIETGPLMRMVQISTPQGTRLLWLAHHLLVDGLSWRILLNDFQLCWQGVIEGNAIQLADKTSSVQAWSEALKEKAQCPALLDEAQYWAAQLPDSATFTKSTNASNTAMGSVSVNWSKSTTNLAQTEALLPYKLTINELLLSAVSLAFTRWSGKSELPLLMEGHGREPISSKVNISETIGWFTSKFPLKLKSEKGDLHRHIQQVKEQCRAIPGKGIGFGILDRLNDEVTFAPQRPQVVFNYLGQFEASPASDIEFADNPASNRVDPFAEQKHALVLNGLIAEGQLAFELLYNTCFCSQAEAQQLADQLQQSLDEIVQYCQSGTAGGPTPSDFPLAHVSQQELDDLAEVYRIEALYPATGMQSGLLFHSELSSDAYVNQMLVTVENLDVGRFKSCWQQMLASYDILRTAFVTTEQGYHQLVTDGQIEWVSKDLSGLSVEQAKQTVEQIRTQDMERGFALNLAPLMRFTLIELPSNKHQILWSHHHALWDGWCNALLLKSVLSLYSGLTLPAAIPQFQSYMDWLSQQSQQEGEQHWQNLCQQNTWSPLPTLSANQLASRSEYCLELTVEQTQQFVAFAQQQKCTPNALLQACWAYVLHRYTGSDDVSFGAVTSGRSAPVDDIENIIGLFINTLPVAVSFEQERSLPDLLSELQKQTLDAEKYSYVPLQKIQQLAGEEVFDTVVIFENYPFDTKDIEQNSDLKLQVSDVETFEKTHYGLSLVVQLQNTLKLKLQVQADTYSENTVSGLMTELAHLCGGALFTSQATTRTLPLQVDEVSKVDRSFPVCSESIGIHTEFERIVQLNPDKVAVEFENASLSYQQLDAKANQLANHLVSLGIGPDSLVGISAERNLNTLIGLLAILKAGAAYLPLDPDFPPNRLGYMLQDSGACLVLEQPLLAEALGSDILPSRLDISTPEFWASMGALSQHKPDVSISSNDLAYVMYTSGSTGQPKGVQIEHAAVVNFLQGMFERVGGNLFNDCRLLAVTTIAFDISVLELFGPIGFGGTVVLASDLQRKDPIALAQLMSDKQIDCMQATPSSWQMLIDIDWPGNQQLTALCGGEPLPLTLANHLLSRCARLFNCYGPTEATIWSLVSEVTADACQQAVPVRDSLPNYGHLVLDKHLRPVPKGSVGELHIFGNGLARGYHNRESLTQDRFVMAPSINNKGLRFYKTGDLVKHLEEDLFEFFGRTDEQVKIRGHRIELGEIAHQLNQSPVVSHAEVITHQAEGKTQVQLIGYVQTDGGALSDEEHQAIQSHLGQALPSYMQLSAIVPLESWPKTPNGKIDKRALPLPQSAVNQTNRVLAKTETESGLVEIIATLMKSTSQEIDVSADFFELGGDSMLAVQFIHRIDQRFPVSAKLPWIYQYPSIQELAAHIDRQLTLQLVEATHAELDNDDIEEFSL